MTHERNQKKQPKSLQLSLRNQRSCPVSEGDFTGFESLPDMAVGALIYNSNSMDCRLVRKAFYSDLLGSQNNLVWSFSSTGNNLYKDFFFYILEDILRTYMSKKTLNFACLKFFFLVYIYLYFHMSKLYHL